MTKIKTRRNERKLDASTIDVALQLVADRAEREGVSKDTAKRHRAAIRGVTSALAVTHRQVVIPGIWAALYARASESAKSTAISNMKFAAVIFEWAAEQDYADKALYARIAKAIRLALAVRG
ncbi:hypothetical protein [Kosakonia sacchari]|uniref:hypothetical protein n=1 Tax=Kosakonia sacchari TaxID=1158459 RepID=UPI001585A6B5|nr:hypothetical protein [Kosakonia sacchari]NUL35096.1 hypothetical protein [Kosakonia sacchari]